MSLNISFKDIEEYIGELLGKDAKLINVEGLGIEKAEGEIKGYGYGTPLLLEVEVSGSTRKYVLNTVRPGQFGHEYMSDRAGILIWNHLSFNKLPRHVKSIDLGYFTRDNKLVSIDTPLEFFQITEYVEGSEYFHDLNRIAENDRVEEIDLRRARALAEYIADVHSLKHRDQALYRRRIRELIGHGEAIMGLIDSYRGDEDFLEEDELKNIELKCVEWRWRIKDLYHRLSRVHGDFHPWNIIFRDDIDFIVLDRSRGEWGEPADDVAALSINYIFFSLIKYGEFRETFNTLWKTFIETYLDRTNDDELFRVIQPFYAWRGLVIANPIWYPNLEYRIRRKIFNFINNVLESDYFDYKNVVEYLSE